jgi:hypothetical protein
MMHANLIFVSIMLCFLYQTKFPSEMVNVLFQYSCMPPTLTQDLNMCYNACVALPKCHFP